MLSQNMNRKLAAIQTVTPEQLYRDIAETRQAKRSQSHLEVLLTMGAIGLGYTFAAMSGAVGAGLLGAAVIGYKWWDAFENLNELENGDLETVKKFLSPHERKRLETDLKQYGCQVDDESIDVPFHEVDQALRDSYGIQQENLAHSLARSPELNAIIVGRSRSGKSTFINAALGVIHGKLPYILDGKPERTNSYAGLKADPNVYLAVNSKDAAMEAIARWENVLELLRKGQTGEPLPQLVVMDEVNNQRLLLDSKDGKVLDDAIALFSTQVMGQGGGIWLSSHSHLVSDVGLNRQLQTSYAVIALGRDGRYSSIEAVLDDALVIRSKVAREALKSQLTAYRDNGGNGAIAFTNLGGDDRLVVLPDYSKLLSPTSAPGAKPSHLQDDAPEWLEQELVQSESIEDVANLNQSLKADPVADLERLYQMDDAEESNPFGSAAFEQAKAPDLENLPKELKAIAEYAASRGDWVKARDVRSGVRILKEGGVTTDQIRTWFLELSDQGFGDVDGEGIHLKYRF